MTLLGQYLLWSVNISGTNSLIITCRLAKWIKEENKEKKIQWCADLRNSYHQEKAT